jgi:hypothetical protein
MVTASELPRGVSLTVVFIIVTTCVTTKVISTRLQPQLPHHHLPHDELLHLAGRRGGEVFDEADVARNFELGDLAATCAMSTFFALSSRPGSGSQGLKELMLKSAALSWIDEPGF